MKNQLILTILFCFSGIHIFSQELNLFLQDIKEERLNGQTQRSTSDSISNITFTTAINGIALDDYHFVKLGKLKVVDETGKRLNEIKGPFYKNDTYNKDKRMEFSVEAANRQVTKIQTVEGSLLYFTPTEANKGKVIILDFLQRKGKNLLANSYPEIELQLMDTDKLFDMQEEMQKMIDKKVEEREKEGPISDEEQEEINYAHQFITDIAGIKERSSRLTTLTFQLNKSLKEVFYRMAIFNENDKQISTGHFSVNNVYQFYLTEQPTRGCYIEILIENKDAVKELPFRFQDIVLP